MLNLMLHLYISCPGLKNRKPWTSNNIGGIIRVCFFYYTKVGFLRLHFYVNVKVVLDASRGKAKETSEVNIRDFLLWTVERVSKERHLHIIFLILMSLCLHPWEQTICQETNKE